jgi:hypothetical protein
MGHEGPYSFWYASSPKANPLKKSMVDLMADFEDRPDSTKSLFNASAVFSISKVSQESHLIAFLSAWIPPITNAFNYLQSCPRPPSGRRSPKRGGSLL